MLDFFLFLLGFLYSLQVHVRSPFILNGVCVRWKGYLDLERLDGVGAIEFDEETANLEDAVMRDTVEAYNRRIKDFEEHNKARQRQLAAFMGHQQQVCSTVYFFFFSLRWRVISQRVFRFRFVMVTLLP